MSNSAIQHFFIKRTHGELFMQRCRVPTIVVLFALNVASPRGIRAADVLRNVPNDALGFVVVNNLAATDGKIDKLLKTIQADSPGPLAFLEAATGVSEGLDPQGDFLLAAIPGTDTVTRAPEFAVWLPVRDYDRFLAALDATPVPGIAAVTIAGEDLLIAHHHSWALVMDPDERERMEQILVAAPSPPAACAEWKDWIEANDAAAVALPNGIRALVAWAADAQPALRSQTQPIGNADEDPFGFGQHGAPDDTFTAAPAGAAPANVTATFRATIRRWTTQSPQLTEWIVRAKAVGCALRLDEEGSALAALRLRFPDESLLAATNRDWQKQSAPPALYQSGNFVLQSAGNIPPVLTALAAGTYARLLVNDLKTEEGMVFRDPIVTRFQQAVERAAAEVASAVVLSQPGDNEQGVYTNNFLVVRAADAASFIAHATEAMRSWNTMHREAKGETPLVFDVEETKIGDRSATQYSLDIAAADGAPPLPEIRQAMEKFFGPGGKLRLWIVPVDETTVLLAAATPEQVAAALEILDRREPVDWNHPELTAANRLLPAEADWRVFFSPHAYHGWLQRHSAAMTGPVFGGRPAKEFLSSPPVGFAGGVRDHEFWLDAAVPAETIQSASAHLKAELNRKR